MTVITRFAPSPTGYLHIGGARTALFSWLFAKKMQGHFILRIEDTDVERSTQASSDAILDAMQWLGLHYDEGPYYQSKRFDRYQEVIEKLLQENKAYRCYCSKERLEHLREEQLANKQKPRYDGFCRDRHDHDATESFVVRFRNPLEGVVAFDDLIRGKVVFDNAELDDLIILRSNGAPTYNFTVVVDDWDMKITHVIRGDDHINNTPRQINMLRALGAALPFYAHVPMILGSDGKRLSKRHGAVSVMQYREEGFLKEALLNYLVRLGWSYKNQEIFSLSELIALFDMKNINRSPAAFNRDKLIWLNQHYLKTLPPDDVAVELAWHMQHLGIDIDDGPTLQNIILAYATRVKTLREMAEKSYYFFKDPVMDEGVVQEKITPELKPALQFFMKECEKAEWNKEALHACLATTTAHFNIGLGAIAEPLRLILTGGTATPPLDMTLFLLGRDKAMARLKKYLH